MRLPFEILGIGLICAGLYVFKKIDRAIGFANGANYGAALERARQAEESKDKPDTDETAPEPPRDI